MRNTPFAIIGTVLTMTALSASGPAFAVDKVFNTEKAEVRVTTFANGLTEPWGLAALPDGGFLVTEKQGNLRFVTSGGKLSEPLRGVPEVDSRGQKPVDLYKLFRTGRGRQLDRRGARRAKR
jgi:glucose/arabinose dehydrogenase